MKQERAMGVEEAKTRGVWDLGVGVARAGSWGRKWAWRQIGGSSKASAAA